MKKFKTPFEAFQHLKKMADEMTEIIDQYKGNDQATLFLSFGINTKVVECNDSGVVINGDYGNIINQIIAMCQVDQLTKDIILDVAAPLIAEKVSEKILGEMSKHPQKVIFQFNSKPDHEIN